MGIEKWMWTFYLQVLNKKCLYESHLKNAEEYNTWNDVISTKMSIRYQSELEISKFRI